jgi:hypothetical protein
MFNPPTTIQQASKRLYGAHPGEGYRVECCAYEIIDRFGGRQCFRKRGYGRAGLYCQQHAEAIAPIVPDAVKPGSKEHLDALSTFFGI